MAIIRHIKIENFRGIRSLDWNVQGRVICLIGPGDSCKTTILDAVEFALSPRWNLAFADTDFFRGNPASPIVIELTIGELPDELVAEDKYGLYLRG
jgi:predicted ATP-dependent endonuclease of OLD family